MESYLHVLINILCNMYTVYLLIFNMYNTYLHMYVTFYTPPYVCTSMYVSCAIWWMCYAIRYMSCPIGYVLVLLNNNYVYSTCFVQPDTCSNLGTIAVWLVRSHMDGCVLFPFQSNQTSERKCTTIAFRPATVGSQEYTCFGTSGNRFVSLNFRIAIPAGEWTE